MSTDSARDVDFSSDEDSALAGPLPKRLSVEQDNGPIQLTPPTMLSPKPKIVPALQLGSLSSSRGLDSSPDGTEENDHWQQEEEGEEIEFDEAAQAEAKEGKWRRQLDDLGGISRDAMLARQRGLTPGEMNMLRKETETSPLPKIVSPGPPLSSRDRQPSNPWEANARCMAAKIRAEIDEELDQNHDGDITKEELVRMDSAIAKVEQKKDGVFAEVEKRLGAHSHRQSVEEPQPAIRKGSPRKNKKNKKKT